MLRTILVLAVAAVGVAYAIQGSLYALLFYLWIAYFRPEQWASDSALLSSLKLSYVVGLAAVVATMFSGRRWRLDLRVTLLVLFLFQSFLSAIFAVHSDYAWPFWVEFFKALVIGYLIVVLADDAARFRLVLLVMAVSLGLEASRQGWVELLLHPGGRNDNPLPMLGDNNGVAVGMLMLVPILTTLAATARTGWERNLHWLMAFGVLYRGISTYSRGGFLTCAALAAVYVLRGQRRVATAAMILIVAMVITPVLPDAFWDRMGTIGTPGHVQEEDTSALGRLHFWNVAIAMASARPWLGVGHNSYNAVYSAYDTSGGAFGDDRSVHSAWFGVLAELGYPGLLLFLAQLALALQACRRARKAAALHESHADLKKFAFAIEAALIAFAVGGTFLPFQYTEMLWHLIALSIVLNGLAVAALRSTVATASPLAAPAWTVPRVAVAVR